MCKSVCLAVLATALVMLAACPTGNEKPGDGDALVVKTGSVTFFNESGYRAEVHLDAFSGPLLVELGSGGMKTVDVRVSDNHGIGTMFSIAYLYRINDGFDADSGDIFAELIDPDVQINRVIEENKSITIQIPHPKNPEFRSAFVKILNAHNMPIELRHLSQVLKQTGNGLVPVPPGKTGVYRLEGIGDGGKQIENHLVFSNFVGTDVPTFTAKNSTVYEFSYNGTSVTKTGEWTIVFN